MIVAAINEQGLWDESDGFYYDQVRQLSDGTAYPVRVRSMTGLLPLCAVASARRERVSALGEFPARITTFLELHPEYRAAFRPATGDGTMMMLALVDSDRLPRVLQRLADEGEFLSRHGIRSLSAAYRNEPFELWHDGHVIASVDYEPAESTTPLFGGNSNWRGPIWFPVNYLVISAIDEYARCYGDDFTIDYPHGSGHQRTLAWVANDLRERLVSIFLPGQDGVRPVDAANVAPDPTWPDALLFYEYFHGDDGRGLGASHQTGWTGLVADLVIRLARDRERQR